MAQIGFSLKDELQKIRERLSKVGSAVATSPISSAIKSVYEYPGLATIKPGDTTKTLGDRLGLTPQIAQAMTTQPTGAFVPSIKPLVTIGTTGVTPVPTQPIKTTITPITQPQQPLTPTTAIQQLQQQIQTQPKIDLQAQITETQTKVKDLKAQQDLINKGYTITAPEEKAAEPTGFEKYAGEVREAGKPVIEALQKMTDTLANLPKSTDEYTRLAAEKGIPEAQTRIKDITSKAYDIEAQIESLPEDVKRRTMDFLGGRQYRERLTEAETKPLTALYNALSRAQGMALQDLEFRRAEVNTMLGLIEKDTERKQEALKVGLEMAKFGAGIETGLAKTGFEAEAEAIKEAKKIPERELGMEKTRAEIEKLRRPEEPKTTSDITNYEYAKQQGYTGNFEQWQATGKPGSILTQTQQNKFAIAGVPNNIALHIQQNLNQGATIQELKDGLAKDLGDANLANQYVDKFTETALKSSADDLMVLLQKLSNL